MFRQLKKAAVVMAVLFILGAAGLLPAAAQTISIGVLPDSGILTSDDAQPKARLNMERALVDIKAIDPETLHNNNGKASIGAEQRSGQGIIIDPSGIIATNTHITGENPHHVYVRLASGKMFEAKIIRSRKPDLTLIKIDAPFPLHAVSLGDSSQVQIGNQVVAFANAGSNAQREKSGQVIQIYREASTDKVAILEVNIRLNPGDSGGPILTDQGLLVGLIMANQISDRRKSYAIASNTIQQEYLRYKGSSVIF